MRCQWDQQGCPDTVSAVGARVAIAGLNIDGASATLAIRGTATSRRGDVGSVKSALLVLLSALSLSAYVSYAPAPLRPSAMAAEPRTRTLDLEQVREEVASIAPDARWSGPCLDRLALFAVALLNSRSIAAARAGIQSAQDRDGSI